MSPYRAGRDAPRRELAESGQAALGLKLAKAAVQRKTHPDPAM